MNTEITKEIWAEYVPQREEQEPESRLSERTVYDGYLREARREVGGLNLSEEDADNEAKDEADYRMAQDIFTGEAAKRQAIRNVVSAADERERNVLDRCRTLGDPLPRDFEHLRPQLKDVGY